MKQKLSLKINIPETVINGFCYPFTKALLEKLKLLLQEGRIDEEYSRDDVVDAILSYLQKQLRINNVSPNVSGAKKIITAAEEFLSIFES